MDALSPLPPAGSLRRGFFAGLVAAIPMLLAVGPFGIIVGVVATETGLDLVQTLAMSAIVIAGASQLAAMQMLTDGAPVLIAILAGAVVNLRMAMYSAALAPWLREAPLYQRAIAATVLHDHSFALALRHYQARPSMPVSHRIGYYLGAGVLPSTVWIGTTWAGAVLGDRLPEGLDLAFILPLSFLAVLAPFLRGWPHAAAAVVAAALALALAGLPYGFGLLVAAAGGIAAGLVLERRP